MLLRKTLQRSRGRKIYRQDMDMHISRGTVQSDGGTLCPALAELIRQKQPVACDENIYQGLERAVKEKSRWKSALLNNFVLMAIFMVLASIQGFFVQVEGKSPLFIAELRIMCIAAVFLILVMMHRKKKGAKPNDVRRCIERREGVTAFYFYISELRWYSPDPDINTDDAYLFAENILFSVSYDMFNSARPGDYFTAVVVDTGSEKLFYIVNYR